MDKVAIHYFVSCTVHQIVYQVIDIYIADMSRKFDKYQSQNCTLSIHLYLLFHIYISTSPTCTLEWWISWYLRGKYIIKRQVNLRQSPRQVAEFLWPTYTGCMNITLRYIVIATTPFNIQNISGKYERPTYGQHISASNQG